MGLVSECGAHESGLGCGQRCLKVLYACPSVHDVLYSIVKLEVSLEVLVQQVNLARWQPFKRIWRYKACCNQWRFMGRIMLCTAVCKASTVQVHGKGMIVLDGITEQ